MKDQEGQIGRRREKKSRKRDTFTEGAVMDLARNLPLGKSPEFHKDDPN